MSEIDYYNEVETLEEQRDRYEQMGNEEKVEALESEIERARKRPERVLDLKIKVKKAKDLGIRRDPAIDALEERIETLEAEATVPEDSDEPGASRDRVNSSPGGTGT